MKRPLCRTALLALCTLTPGTAAGQGDTYARIGFSTAQVYENNLFAAPRSGEPESDLVSRFGSDVEAGYLSNSLKLAARYSLDAERYRRHPELNRSIARQDGGIELRYVPIQRLALDASVSYVETHSPLELNLASQLALGRVRAERVTAGSMATYRWDRATNLAIDYAFVGQLAAQTLAAAIHSPRVGLERRRSARTLYRMGYRVRYLGANDDGATEVSHSITTGLTQELTRLVGVEIDIGPRLSEGAIRPEIAAVLRRRARHGEISLEYAQTQTAPVGERGMVDLRSVVLRVTYAPTRHLTCTAAPGVARSARHGRHVTVRSLDVQATVQFARGWSLVASSRLGEQEGALAGLGGVIPYRSLSTALRVAFPGLSRV